MTQSKEATMYYADPWDEGPRLESLLDGGLPDHEQPVLAVDRPRKVAHPVPHHPTPLVSVDHRVTPDEPPRRRTRH